MNRTGEGDNVRYRVNDGPHGKGDGDSALEEGMPETSRIPAIESKTHSAKQPRLRRRSRMNLVDEILDGSHETVSILALAQVQPDSLNRRRIKVLRHSFDHALKGKDQLRSGRVMVLPEREVHSREQQEEDDIDDGRGRLEEVVVVAGEELAQLVDEDAEPRTGQDRREPPHVPAKVRQKQYDTRHHQRAAPEHMGDMDALAADLREAGQVQVEAHAKQRADGGDEERLQVQVVIQAGNEVASHSAIIVPACQVFGGKT